MAERKKPRKWLQGERGHAGAIKHPGALTRAAAAHGKSKIAEARAESHSSNPHIRGRGILGLRLMGAAKHGNIRKPGMKRKTHPRGAARR